MLGGFFRATEIDARLVGMLGALALIWIGVDILSGGAFLTPRNLWNLSVQTASVMVMSAGMVLTLPTGPSLTIVGQSNISDVVFQPFVGGIWHCGDFFAVNFASLAVTFQTMPEDFVKKYGGGTARKQCRSVVGLGDRSASQYQ